MNQNASTKPDRPLLSGSELVFLRGDQFAPAASGLSTRVQLLHVDVKVKARDLGAAILASAILGSEASGDISLAPRSRKTLLGLRTVNTLFADPGAAVTAWPEHSLEARIHDLVAQGSIETGEMVYRLLGKDETDPWILPIVHTQQGLHRRGLLEVEEGRVLKLIKTHYYKLPERTAALTAESSLDEVQRLLTETPKVRPDLWQMLTEQVKKGVSRRKEVAEVETD